MGLRRIGRISKKFLDLLALPFLMESIVSAQDDGYTTKAEEKSNCDQSRSTTSEFGSQFLCTS